MKCEFCPNVAVRDMLIEIRRATINTNTSVGKMRIKSNRTARVCQSCYDRLKRTPREESRKTNQQIDGQMDVYEVLRLIKEEE